VGFAKSYLSFGLQFALELSETLIFMLLVIYRTGKEGTNESVSWVKPYITPKLEVVQLNLHLSFMADIL
jgi:hypothetical protein